MMDKPTKKKERNFPELQLNEQVNNFCGVDSANPVLIIQSPKTPTLSRKQKASSLDSHDAQQSTAVAVECCRDVSSVPNTPKKHAKPPECAGNARIGGIGGIGGIAGIPGNAGNAGNVDIRDFAQKLTLTPLLGSNLRRFASNTSISGSQTLKTLPEVMTLHEFTGNRSEPVRIKAKGLLERRGSNASLTIDLGSNSNLNETKQTRTNKLNTAKSVSNLNLSSFGVDKCACPRKANEKCANCTIYESVPTKSRKHELCKCNLKFLPRYYVERHCVCNIKFRRKSLSNENLYVPPCNFCHFGSKDCFLNRACNKGSRKALYPRQTYIETSQLLSEDFKLHLQNVQYLQTAGCVLSVADLKSCCQMEKIPRLHQEFWEVPLNLQEKCLVSGSQSRNRYKGVLPNEHSRVLLPGAQPYIHANYIKGPDYTETAYIATQGPMSHTCEDFWTMVWANNVRRIVMLTALVERGRSKCELYFPLGEQGEAPGALYSDGTSHMGLMDSASKLYHPQFSYDEDVVVEVAQTNHQEWGPFLVKYISKEYVGKCIIRKLELSRGSPQEVPETPQSPEAPKASKGETRNVYHYWYPNWADHKLANPEQVLNIALHVLDGSAPVMASTTSSTINPTIPKNPTNTPHTSTTSNNTCSAASHASSTSSTPGDRKSKKTAFDFDVFECKKTTSFESSLKDNHMYVENNRKRMNYAASKGAKLNGGGDAPQTPVLVHCSAGIGRTGCFLAILNGIQQLRTNFNVDILAIVCSLRLNRGGMVQTAEQYELIHRVLSLYADMV